MIGDRQNFASGDGDRTFGVAGFELRLCFINVAKALNSKKNKEWPLGMSCLPPGQLTV
jgi:hypothetical protein